MLIKMDTKSARVKGLSFHPKRRWLLVSHLNGVIQLWDYSEKTLIDKYDEHKGPVRGLDFHHHQPLFVSGGDDSKIKVWNYKYRRCLFTLDAHEDYIRTTFFHREHPWIVSCSDDQSIRIWNWQSRSRIAVLTGHTHYIMCAQFHPTKELILSASIDQTLRVWDISELKMKNKSKSGMSRDEIVTGLPEILTKTDYTVVPNDAHSQEINWCAFHNDPKKPLCLSAADDNYVKLWQLDERNSLRSVDILRGHFNNVSCATFITMQGKDFIISVSEDKTIKIWDIEKRCAISTHRRESDRFWTCAAHPTENIYAAGHDNGFLVFKLEKERPPFCVYKDYLLFIRRRQIVRFNLKTKATKPIQTLMPRTEMSQCYQRLHCYSYDEKQASSIVVSVKSNKSVYDIYTVQGDLHGTGREPRRKPGLTAIYIGPNRIAVLDDSKHVYFRINDEDKKPKIPIQADQIFEAGSGKLYIKHKVDGAHAISLWDIEKGCGLHTIRVDAKFVIMNDSKSYVACVGSHKITICDAQLKVLSTVQEQRKIKSVIWEETGVLVYSTPAQIKYALTNGLVTTIMAVKQTHYLVAIRDQNLYSIERSGNVSVIPVDTREFKFKQAVIRSDRAAILNSIRSLGTLSRCEIAFLVQKGHPGLALKFVHDHESRFKLALRAFEIDEALKSASQLNKRHHWLALAQAAMQIGNVEAAERAYIELKQPYKLAMLYLVCDQRDKLVAAREMSRELRDSSTEFIISLLLKDFTECVQIIRRRGHSALAYISALNHGLKELASEIRSCGEISSEQLAKLPEIDDVQPSFYLESQIPNINNAKFKNWPLLNNESDKFEEILNNETEEGVEVDDGGDWDDANWGDEDEEDSDVFGLRESKSRQKFNASDLGDEDDEQLKDIEDDDDGEDGWQEDDEPLEDLLDDDEDDCGSANPSTAMPDYTCGPSPLHEKWIKHSDCALHQILAGSVKNAIACLRSQIGLKEMSDPLKQIMRDLIMQSKVAYKGLEILEARYAYPSFEDREDRLRMPNGGFSITDLEERLLDCYKLFSQGKFESAIEQFRLVLLSLIFVKTSSSSEESSNTLSRCKDIAKICKEYIISIQIWLARKKISGKGFEENKRACELAAYFSKLDLPKHRSIKLQEAFKVFLARKEFLKTRAASSVAKRLLDVLPATDAKSEKLINSAKQVTNMFDPQKDDEIKLAFDDMNPYSICAASFTPIYTGNKLVDCSLCRSTYKPEFNGTTCRVCSICEVGKKCLGLRNTKTKLEEN